MFYRGPGGSADKPRVHEALTLLPRWERKGTQASELRTALLLRLCVVEIPHPWAVLGFLAAPHPSGFLRCGEWERVLAGVQGLLIIAVAPLLRARLQRSQASVLAALGLSTCGSQA